ncbi:MAG: class III lanthipeptide [Mycobacteriales bacterium]
MSVLKLQNLQPRTALPGAITPISSTSSQSNCCVASDGD